MNNIEKMSDTRWARLICVVNKKNEWARPKIGDPKIQWLICIFPSKNAILC